MITKKREKADSERTYCMGMGKVEMSVRAAVQGATREQDNPRLDAICLSDKVATWEREERLNCGCVCVIKRTGIIHLHTNFYQRRVLLSLLSPCLNSQGPQQHCVNSDEPEIHHHACEANRSDMSAMPDFAPFPTSRLPSRLSPLPFSRRPFPLSFFKNKYFITSLFLAQLQVGSHTKW